MLKEYGFTGRLSHSVTVPAGPDGRPGERLLLPSRNAWNSEISRDGARHDCQALLTRRGSLLLVVCLGRVSDRGDPWVSAYHAIDSSSRMRTRSGVLAPEADAVAGLPAVKYALGQRNGETLYEWKFDQEGWLYAVGILMRPGDAAALEIGRRALSMWRWQSEVVVTEPILPTPKTAGALHFTRTINASPEVVWTVLRTLEGQAALRAPVADAFVVAQRAHDLGERFAFVSEHERCRRTTLVEVLEESPLQHLVTWNPHNRDENFRLAFQLRPLPLRGETSVTVTVQYSVSDDHKAALRQRIAADRVVVGILHRLKTIAERAAHARA
jgi:uncharacterized protein YndB with AHSA1/START domain